MSSGWAFKCDYCGAVSMSDYTQQTIVQPNGEIRMAGVVPPADWVEVTRWHGPSMKTSSVYCSDVCGQGALASHALAVTELEAMDKDGSL